MTRVLPGVYVSLNDLSQIPEGAQSLNVGYVLKANRGPVNEWNLVTNPTDFLTKYTFSGTVKPTDDPTFYSILKVMAQTNSMYIVRAANNPLYGGVIIKKAKDYGRVVSVSKDDETITLEGTVTPEAGEVIMLAGTNVVDGYYIVESVSGKVIKVTGDITQNYGKIANVESFNASSKFFTVEGDVTEKVKKDDSVSVKFTYTEDEEEIVKDFTVASSVYDSSAATTTVTVKEAIRGLKADAKAEGIYFYGQATGSDLVRCPIAPLSAQKIVDIYSVDLENNAFILDGNVAAKFTVKDKITVKNSSEVGYATNDGDFTVVDAEFDLEENKTILVVEEELVEGTDGEIYFNSIVNPDNFVNFFSEDDLMLITGIDAGAYNGDLAFSVLSPLDNQNDFVYFKGAKGIFDKPCPFDTMQLNVVNSETGETLESFTFSRDNTAKAIDGSSLFVDQVVEGSAWIKVVNNPASTDVPNSSLAGAPLQASGGSDGGTVDASTMVKALDVFADKTIPLSILGNGCSAEAESAIFQQALIELATTRKDLMVFLGSRKQDEKATLPSTRAANIVDYKKNTLANTSFYGCMYAPHVKTPDIFNNGTVEIGTDAVAIAGWLNVLNNLSYPYAYAGPRNGLVSGVTCDWKIGDLSGEAEQLNDASINYVAYDGRVGRYYMQTQNTLQVANSSLRNIGAVLNILDIKETLAQYLKEYLQLPITDTLRANIVTTANDYLSPMQGIRFYNYAFSDITTDLDIADNTLRFLLALSLTAYAQRIYLAINVVRAGFDFSILQSA